jgi:NTE family protein
MIKDYFPGSCRFRIVVLIALSLLLNTGKNTPGLLAQDLTGRPRVGLVLSGGGALGLAHVGVLKVMEESGLRPDLITGVSMGSIIGGMYAIGYRADTLQKLIVTNNWDMVFSNKIPENKVIYPEKRHFQNSILTFPVSLKKVRLPSGFINGQQVENLLSFYAWQADDIDDFSKLPIPFMCLATNLMTFKIVELTHGYLPDAMRASSAVPSVFSPLKIDSVMLIDGGVVRNFAASEAREMGADIIIGCYTGIKNRKEEKPMSVLDILKQLGFYNALNDFKEEKKLVNLLIQPDLEGFSSTKFSEADSIIQRGYKAALPYRTYFKKLADSLNEIYPQRPLENIMNKKYYTFDDIEINGNEIYSDDQILGVLDIDPGVKVDKYMMNEKIDLLYGKAWFEKVKYRFVRRNDSLILALDCIEKPRAIFYGSIHYDESLKSGILIGLSIKNLLTKRSVIDLNALIGQYYRVQFDYYQFIDRNQKYSLSANIYADNSLFPRMKIEGEIGNVISRNLSQGLTLSKRLGLNNMMLISASYNMMNLIPDFYSENGLKKTGFNYFSSNYEYKVNTLDIKHFPNRGALFNFSAGTSKLLNASITYDTLRTIYDEQDNNVAFKRFYTIKANFRNYFSPGKMVTLSFKGDFLYISDSDSISSRNNFFTVGGMLPGNYRSIPMTGYRTNEIAVTRLAGIGAEIDFEIVPDLHLSLMSDVFAARLAGQNNGYSFFTGFGLGAGYMSMIGPLKVGIMYGQNRKEGYQSDLKGFISFGYNF